MKKWVTILLLFAAALPVAAGDDGLSASNLFRAGISVILKTPASRPEKGAALEKLKESAVKGDAAAQFELGARNFLGEGIARDEAEAVKSFKSASDKSNADARIVFAACQLAGIGGQTNAAEGYKTVDRIAERGDARAQFVMGVCHAEGVGATKDVAEALVWFRKAVEKNHPAAQMELGLLLFSGAAKDPKEGFDWLRKSANQNFTLGQFILGSILIDTTGPTRDEGIGWFRRAAEAGMIAAQCELGSIYYQGAIVTRDYAEAVKWLRKAADQGDPGGQKGIGILYVNGHGVPQDPAEAVKWLQLASQQNDKGATADLAKLKSGLGTEFLTEGMKRAQAFTPKKSDDDSPTFYDPSKSEPSEWGKVTIGNPKSAQTSPASNAVNSVDIGQLRAAAEKGDAESQTKLGIRLKNGIEVKRDVSEAEGWFRKAAGQKYPEGELQLGLLQTELRDVSKQKEGRERLLKLAETGYARAQAVAGMACFAEIAGAPPDTATGLKLLLKAGEQGEPIATFFLGLAYANGTNGVPRNDDESIKWLRKTCETIDHGLAQYVLGQQLVMRKRTPAEQAEGVKWLKSAAEQNIGMAQMILAMCYDMGTGTEKDNVEAFKWYQVAYKDTGHEAQIPPDLLDKLTPAEMAEGSRRAAAFKPRKPRLKSGVSIEEVDGFLKSK